jgi:hypothetical protein
MRDRRVAEVRFTHPTRGATQAQEKTQAAGFATCDPRFKTATSPGENLKAADCFG